MALPKDPVILLSMVNMKLRDRYTSLDALCEDMDEDRLAIEETLKKINYTYNEATNCFE